MFTVFVDWQTTANQHIKHHRITAHAQDAHIYYRECQLPITNFLYITAIHERHAQFF